MNKVDIGRTAYALIQMQGDLAELYADSQAELADLEGDQIAAFAWRRMVTVITALRNETTVARRTKHMAGERQGPNRASHVTAPG
jgi:hypothetical protein